jgi:protocatechuate 4,5-dioxygenase alpha subunit
MSVYQLNKLCYDLKKAENRAAWQNDAEAFYDRYDLTPEEREMLREADFAGLWDCGVNIYVLIVLVSLHGMALNDLTAVMQRGCSVEVGQPGPGARPATVG